MSDNNSEFGDLGDFCDDLLSGRLAEHFGQHNDNSIDQSTSTEKVTMRESSTQTVESVTPEISTDSSADSPHFVVTTDIYTVRRPKRRLLNEPIPSAAEESPIDVGFHRLVSSSMDIYRRRVLQAPF